MASDATTSGEAAPKQRLLEDPEKFLQPWERWTAGAVGLVLLATAGWIGVFPPARSVPVVGCTAPPSTCTVSVAADLATLAIAVVAAGSAALLVGLFGVRFTSVKAGGVELATSPTAATEATPKIDAVQGPDHPPAPAAGAVGETVDAPSVVATRLHDPMSEEHADILRTYQSARRTSQRGYFLTHALGPPTTRGQEYSVALKVVAHKSASGDVQRATFFMGRSWGNGVFEGKRGVDGRFGVTTEAYGPFLAVCELTFADGDRVLLDHYCDFEMGVLVPR